MKPVSLAASFKSYHVLQSQAKKDCTGLLQGTVPKASFSSFTQREEKVSATSGLPAGLRAAWTPEEALLVAEDTPIFSLSRAA